MIPADPWAPRTDPNDEPNDGANDGPIDDGTRYDPFTLEPIDPAELEPLVEFTGPRPPPNAWAASIDWVGLLEEQIREAERQDHERERQRRLRQLAAPHSRRRTFPLDVGDQVGTSMPVSTRLPRWLEQQLRQEFEALGVSTSTGVRQILEEWWVARRYPALEFRGEPFLRTASVRGGPDIRAWAESDPRPLLEEGVQEQVLDYVGLFRGRLGSTPSPEQRAGRAR